MTPKFPEIHFGHFWSNILGFYPAPLDAKICLKPSLRDAFKKKKKNVTKVTFGGGGPDVKMSHFYKLCFKSISSHSESI